MQIEFISTLPLSEVAQACFGTSQGPADRPIPQVSRKFDVGDPAAVQAAADELRLPVFSLRHDGREEPWGQTVARLQSPEGAIIGISHIPSMHG